MTNAKCVVVPGEPPVKTLCRHPHYNPSPRSRARYGDVPHEWGPHTQTIELSAEQVNDPRLTAGQKIVLGKIQYLERLGKWWNTTGLAKLLGRVRQAVQRDLRQIVALRSAKSLPIPPNHLSRTDTSPVHERCTRDRPPHPPPDRGGEELPDPEAIRSVAEYLRSQGIRSRMRPERRECALLALARRVVSQGVSLHLLRQARSWASRWRWKRDDRAVFASWLNQPRIIKEKIQWLVSRKRRRQEAMESRTRQVVSESVTLDVGPAAVSPLQELLASSLRALAPQSETGSASSAPISLASRRGTGTG